MTTSHLPFVLRAQPGRMILVTESQTRLPLSVSASVGGFKVRRSRNSFSNGHFRYCVTWLIKALVLPRRNDKFTAIY